jgi:hypothetical protein
VVDVALVALCLNLIPPSAANVPESPESDSEAAQEHPVPLTPSREPDARGLQLSLLVGIDILAWTGYSYDTRVSLQGAPSFQYRGTAGAPGVMLSFGAAVRLPGAMRRITIGASTTGGGLKSNSHPVIPAGVSTPFSQTNLQNQIRYRYSYAPGWSPALFLSVEHDVGFFHDGRIRAGYQYRRQTGLYTGAFEPFLGNHAWADYNVRLESRSHLIRVSVNDYISFQDPDIDPGKSHRPRRRAGLIRQWGISVGTNRTAILFAAIGPIWDITH